MFWRKGAIYFAHSLRDYHQTKECSDMETIKAQFPLYQIVNPNGLLPNGNGWLAEAQRLIKKCELLVFTEWSNHIGRGVSNEIDFALAQGLSVYLLREGQFYPITQVNIQPSGRDNWVLYRKVVLCS